MEPPVTWEQIVSYFLDDLYAEDVAILASEICDIGVSPAYEDAPYYWDISTSVLTITTTGPITNPCVFHGGTGTELQVVLNLAQMNGVDTVYLAQKAVVSVTSTIRIPTGLTLTTWTSDASPLTPVQYARMGRLVRDPSFFDPYDGPMVQMDAGSTLCGVWVDGRYRFPRLSEWGMNVNIVDDGTSALTTTLVNCRLSDSANGTLVKTWGTISGYPCGNVYIGHNLFTGYANSHYEEGQWADAISIGCEHTTAEYNQIVDPTDVGIVVFRCGPTCTQESQVRHNLVLHAGNSAWGSYGADPYLAEGEWYDFSGTVFEQNLLWTSPTAHVDISLYAGIHALYKTANPGWGVSFISNTTGILTARANTPIAVSGMLTVTMSGNDLEVEVVPTNRCCIPSNPTVTIILASVSYTDPWPLASFALPEPLYEDVLLEACWSPHVSFPNLVMFLPLVFKNPPFSEQALPPSAPVPESGYPLPLRPADGYPSP